MAALTALKNDTLIKRFMEFYEDFSLDNLGKLDNFYTPDIEFIDPIHRVDGILSLKRYLKKMAGNLSHYRIHYLDSLAVDNMAYLTWEMEFAHKRINGGQVVMLRGMSHLKFTSRVYYHEDCYDLGALVYEHLPLIGSLTRSVKARMAGLGN